MVIPKIRLPLISTTSRRMLSSPKRFQDSKALYLTNLRLSIHKSLRLTISSSNSILRVLQHCSKLYNHQRVKLPLAICRILRPAALPSSRAKSRCIVRYHSAKVAQGFISVFRGPRCSHTRCARLLVSEVWHIPRVCTPFPP